MDDYPKEEVHILSCRMQVGPEETVPKPFDIIDEFMRIQMAPYRYLVALEEARERQEKADKFVERYPHVGHAKRLDMLSREYIALPPQRSNIPSRKKRR